MNGIVIGKHTLESLTTGMYADPFVVFREYIQNSADAIDEAQQLGLLQKGEEFITITIHPFEHTIIIEDNGIGVSSALAESTLISVGNSKKVSVGLRGFRGIGRLAGLGYCNKLLFETSCYGESKGTCISIDAKELNAKLVGCETEFVSAEEVLADIYSIRTFVEKEHAHYFRVTMIDIDDSSHLCDSTRVYDYLSQNAPVPYNNECFSWGDTIREKMRIKGYSIPEYNITLIISGEAKPVYKPLSDYFPLDKSGNTIDVIKGIRFIDFKNSKGDDSSFGWIADTSYLGSICDKKIKGLRIRDGNILIGDEQTLNIAFKDARFNGWSIGEIFTIDPTLIPNARRDNFEKTPAYFVFMEQMQNLAAEITKSIRNASVERNKKYSLNTQGKEVINSVKVSKQSKQSRLSSFKKNYNSTKKVLREREIGESELFAAQEIPFDELDILIGRLNGITGYKSLNALRNINNNDKKVLEKVFDVILSTDSEHAERIIDAILRVFSYE